LKLEFDLLKSKRVKFKGDPFKEQKDYLLAEIEEKCKLLTSSKEKTSNQNASKELEELNNSKTFLGSINTSTFSLTKILETHRAFQTCRNVLVPR
jgi:hypothetical protein